MTSFKKLGYSWTFNGDLISFFRDFSIIPKDAVNKNQLHMIKADTESVEELRKIIYDLPDTN